MKHKLKATITFEYEVDYDSDKPAIAALYQEMCTRGGVRDEWVIDSGFDVNHSTIKIEPATE